MTYQVIITEEVANVAVTSESYPIIIEYNATNLANASSSYGNANVAAYLASGTNTSIIDNIGNIGTVGSMAAGGSMIATGNVTGGNITTAGQVSATGNITGNYFIGNGSLLTGIATSSYGNANVAAYLPTYTGNVGAGNINVSGVVYTPQVESSGDLDLNTAGVVNVNGNIRLGDNNSNTQIATHGTGDLILTTHQGDAAQGNIRIYDGANGNIAITPNGTGVVTTTAVSASGNVTAAYVIGNGSALTSLTGANVSGTVANAAYALTSNAATYSTIATYADTANAVAGANVSGTVANATYATSAGSATTATTAGTVTTAAQGNITSVGTLTSLSVSGNITGGNVVSLGTVTAAGNLMSTQQTIVGTANVGTTGNIVVSGRNIATDMAFVPDGTSAFTAGAYQGRVLIGTGFAGNANVGNPSRFSVFDTIDRGNNASAIREIESEVIVNLTGNVTNNSFRQQSVGARIRVGGGAAANTTALGSAIGAPFSMSAGQFNLDIGNTSPYFLGNTNLSHATINGGVFTISGGSNVGNAYGFIGLAVGSGSGTGNITNYLGYSSSFSANVTGNLFCFYNGNTTSVGSYGVQTANAARQATNYYFLRNDDDLAQNQLGSLRKYHEFESATATSGSFAIDKATAQVHNIVPTANCTITGYSNMVTSASDGTNTDSQVDTLTIIVEQGATPYYITLPTGAAYKYAGNVSTVGVTANSVTMISVTAANVSGTVTYLTTVSPEFV